MRSIGAILIVLGACTAPDVPCDQSLLYRDSGYTLSSPPGTSFAPTVIFSDPDGERPDECHYARNQGDQVCTEPGGWVDLNPGAKDGTLMVTPHEHACGGFAVESSYSLTYSFTKIQGILWIETWSNNQ
jgi:hypothetical protein